MKRQLLRLRSSDWLLNAAALTLLFFGLAAIYSVALSQEGGDLLNVKKHLVAMAIGLILFLLAARANYRLLRNYGATLYVIGCCLLVAVLFFGATIRGTTGWFELGPVNFQPVELMKIILPVALAAYFSRGASARPGWREIGASAAIVGVPVLLVAAQPDLGSAALLMGVWGTMLLYAGLRARHAAVLAGALGIAGAIAWSFLLASYQRSRIMTFLDPSADPLGQGYNVRQAIIAVGAGGLVGRGLGFGSQSQLKFLPESQTDFVFAVIAEELGFVGIALVLVAFLMLFLRIANLSGRAVDDFTSLLIMGLGSALFWQFLVNAGMNLGLMPVTGVGLPLVSYGGSALVVALAALGIIQSAQARGKARD